MMADSVLAQAMSTLSAVVSTQGLLPGLKNHTNLGWQNSKTLVFRSQSLCYHGKVLPRARLNCSGERVLCLIKSSLRGKKSAVAVHPSQRSLLNIGEPSVINSTVIFRSLTALSLLYKRSFLLDKGC